MHSDEQLSIRAYQFEHRLLTNMRRLLERVVGGVRSEIVSGELNGLSERMARLIEPAERFLAEPCSRCGGCGREGKADSVCAKCHGNGY